MRISLLSVLLLTSIAFNSAFAQNENSNLLPAITKSVPNTSLIDYKNYSPLAKKIIDKSLELASQHLTYLYGSANPSNGGMDCSGTIYYLLSSMTDKKIPRQADEIFAWLDKEGKIHRVQSDQLESAEFKELKPGDLLFWSGTYSTGRDITHVMLYLGKTKDDKQLMFGSSDGRTFEAQRMRGVSVFDFRLPKKTDKAKFVGYGCIPYITC